MNTAHRKALMGIWWPDACAQQGWDRNDRDRRLDVLSKAVGRSVQSANDIDDEDDIKRVRRYLLQLSQPPKAHAKPQVSPTLQMLRFTFGRAVNAYCKRESIERMDDTDVANLADRWTTEALGMVVPWNNLGNQSVDLLKAYLLLQVDPDNEVLQAAWANAGPDGQARRMVAHILESAKLIRLIQYQLGDVDGEWYLTDAGAESYVDATAIDKNVRQDWRNLLLPLLDELTMTIENRKRMWINKGVEAKILDKLPGGKVRFLQRAKDAETFDTRPSTLDHQHSTPVPF